MTWTRLISAALLALLVAPPAMAEWKTEFDAGAAALKNKDFRTAENHLITALGDADAFKPTDTRRVDTVMLLADVYRNTRQWAAGAALYDQVLKAYKDEGTDQSRTAANVQNKLGVAHYNMRNWEKAEKAWTVAYAIYSMNLRRNAGSRSAIENNLAELYRRQGKWDEAEKLLTNALETKEQELGPDHEALISTLVDLGLAEIKLKKNALAVGHLDRALVIAKVAEKDKGEKTATVLHNLGLAHDNLRNYEKALSNYTAALAMRDAVLVGKHPHIANTLNNLGNLHGKMGAPEKGVPMLQRAIKIREFEFGAKDKSVLSALRNLSILLDKLDRNEELKAVQARIDNFGKTK